MAKNTALLENMIKEGFKICIVNPFDLLFKKIHKNVRFH